MDKKIAEMCNDQINKEFYAAYLYLEISNYYDEKGLDGFAAYYQKQVEEEEGHAMSFYKYLHDNNEHVTLQAVAKPEAEFNDLADPLKAALNHECYVTGLIGNIYTAAVEANDYRTEWFLDGFIDEQAEEEKSATDLITKMELYGGDPAGLYMLNKELGERE